MLTLQGFLNEANTTISMSMKDLDRAYTRQRISNEEEVIYLLNDILNHFEELGKKSYSLKEIKEVIDDLSRQTKVSISRLKDKIDNDFNND